jgi:hypothetical protein
VFLSYWESRCNDKSERVYIWETISWRLD